LRKKGSRKKPSKRRKRRRLSEGRKNRQCFSNRNLKR